MHRHSQCECGRGPSQRQKVLTAKIARKHTKKKAGNMGERARNNILENMPKGQTSIIYILNFMGILPASLGILAMWIKFNKKAYKVVSGF